VHDLVTIGFKISYKKCAVVIPLDRLTVDEMPLRAEAGLDPELPQQAIDGASRNMLDKVPCSTKCHGKSRDLAA
jgi:hypothetical protein